jgi:hypothetical protein
VHRRTTAAAAAHGKHDQVREQIDLVMWMGYTPPPPEADSLEYLSIERMVTEFEASHPNVTIELQYVNSDNALQKATVALQGGEQPDISYQYGTNMPQLATSPMLVDLPSASTPPSTTGTTSSRQHAVATVDGCPASSSSTTSRSSTQGPLRGRGAGRERTWDLLGAAAAIRPGQQGGSAVFPGRESETTVWQYIAMLWRPAAIS